MSTKQCAKCREAKPLSEYHRSVTSRDGRAARCKSCRSQDSRRYAERRRAAEASAEERAAVLEQEGVNLDR